MLDKLFTHEGFAAVLLGQNINKTLHNSNPLFSISYELIIHSSHSTPPAPPDSVRPVCLPPYHLPLKTGEQLVVTGWGLLQENGTNRTSPLPPTHDPLVAGSITNFLSTKLTPTKYLVNAFV